MYSLQPAQVATETISTGTTMKDKNLRSKAMLQAAEGQACVNCGARDGTVVAAHYQGMRGHIFGKGKGIKPHDLCIADLCAKCHSAFDKSDVSLVKDPYMRKIDHSELFLFCVMQTLIRRVRQDVLFADDLIGSTREDGT
jgi:hypothetical protein